MFPGDSVLTWMYDMEWADVIDIEKGVLVAVFSHGQKRAWDWGTGIKILIKG